MIQSKSPLFSLKQKLPNSTTTSPNPSSQNTFPKPNFPNTMPPIHSTPFKNIQNPSSLLSLLRHTNPNDTTTTTNTTTTTTSKKSSSTSTKSGSSRGGLLKMLKLFPMLTSGCKMVALLASGSRHRTRHRIADHATIGTLFGHKRGRMTLAIQEDPHCVPKFVIELPIIASAFHKEMACDVLRVALESETKSHKKKLMEEFVWAVYCNGRKVGYSIRRTQLSEDEVHVMNMLRGVSMGAGVLPPYDRDYHRHDRDRDHHDGDDDQRREKGGDNGDQLTYLRARFERVVGSKDSEALYMINPDNSDGPELSIFFVRGSLN